MTRLNETTGIFSSKNELEEISLQCDLKEGKMSLLRKMEKN